MIAAIEVFIRIWLGAALFNMWMGVARGGHSVGEAFPLFLVIVVIAAAAALLIWWKFLWA